MVDIIKQKLRELEQENNIRVLYACESGSRAWGFPSPDSDFDVRFIYTRLLNDYLGIIEIRDVVDLPVSEVLDIGGWDLKKALKLFLKSNGPLYEWLQAPIIYESSSGFVQELRELMPKYFSLKAAGHHYFSMASNTVNNDLQGEQIKLKRLFYALRSTLVCKWLIEKQTVPPMELAHLRVLVDDSDFQTTLNELLKRKAISDEKTLIDHIPLLTYWLNATLADCKTAISALPANHQQPEELNRLFRKYLS
jgi:predicted nucleotidyltransferase